MLDAEFISELQVGLPDWLLPYLAKRAPCITDEDKIRLAIDLSRENVVRGSGGPFGAVIFEVGTSKIISAGVNSVLRTNNSVLHAEVLAIMLAQARMQSFTLRSSTRPACELFTSCDPCAMCLGAILWSGVRRIVCAADREDASRIGFEEGPVFPESLDYLRQRGLTIETGLLRAEARDVLDLYLQTQGIVYNG